MINLIISGDIDKHGYCLILSLLHPRFIYKTEKNVFRGMLRHIELNASTKFYLTEDNNSFIIGFSILGFGLQISARVKNFLEGDKRE